MLRAHAGPYYRTIAAAFSMTVCPGRTKCPVVETIRLLPEHSEQRARLMTKPRDASRACRPLLSNDCGRAQHESLPWQNEMPCCRNNPHVARALGAARG